MATTQNTGVLIDDDDGAVVKKQWGCGRRRKALNSMPAAALQQQSKKHTIEITKVTWAPSSDPKGQLSQDEIADDLCRYPQHLLEDEDPPFLSSWSMSLLPKEDETPSMISDEPLNLLEERFLLLPLTYANLHTSSSQDPATHQLKAVPRVERKRRLLKAVPRVERKRRLPV